MAMLTATLKKVAAFSLAALLVSSGVAGSNTPAVADDVTGTSPTLTVNNGNKVEVSAWGEEIQYQAQISVPAGTSVAAGAVSTVVLPPEVEVLRYDKQQQASMTAPPTFNASTRTFTINWSALSAGSLYSFPFVGVPSPATQNDSTFVVEANLLGSLTDGTPIDIASVSNPIAANGDFTMKLVEPGDWAFETTYVSPTQVGQANSGPYAVQKATADAASFTEMRWRVHYDDPDATASRANLSIINGLRDSANSTVLVDNGDLLEISNGAVNFQGVDTLQFSRSFNAVGLEPGDYSVPVDLVDIRPDGTEVLVAQFDLVLTVLEPSATTVAFHSGLTREQVEPGDTFRYIFGTVYAASAAVTGLSYTVAVPHNTTVETFVSGRHTTGQLVTGVEYSADGITWTPMAGAGPVWDFSSLDNPASISMLRFTERDAAREVGQSDSSLTFRVKEDTHTGGTISVRVEGAEYVDPVAGPSTSAPSGVRRVSVVESYSGEPVINGLAINRMSVTNGFGSPYYNGQSIRQDLRLNAQSSAPLEDPYMFVIVPAGMTTSANAGNASLGLPSWDGALVHTEGGTGQNTYAYGALLGKPAQAEVITETVLSDGSRLLFWSAPNFGLTGTPPLDWTYETLMSDLNFNLVSMSAGNHTVQVGMGSASNNSFSTGTGNTFSVSTLDDPAALGGFSNLYQEVNENLQGQGVNTKNLLVRSFPFSVPGSDSVSVTTNIQGSEDENPIPGGGTATSRLGAATSYQILVKNDGTYAYDNFQFIDILPYANDTYTLSNASRGSTFDLSIGQRPVVTLNGNPVDSIVEVSRSENPSRFDAAGNATNVPGTSWESIAGGTDGMRAVRVTLPESVAFKPGDVIALDFVASIPLSAPRDGSIANNSVAYRLERPGYTTGLETDAGAVQVPAAATDFELSGQLFDSFGQGVNGGMELHLYKLDQSGNPVATGDVSAPAANGDERGVWGFVGLDAGETYLVKPVVSDDHFVIDESQISPDGFLVYDYRGQESTVANAPYNVSSFAGRDRFLLSDAVGSDIHWLKDLNITANVLSDIKGDVVFVDINGAIVGGAEDYLTSWGVSVEALPAGTQISSGETEASGSGLFELAALNLAGGSYNVTFSDLATRGLVFALQNQPSGFDVDTGVYTQNELVPGAGIDDLRIRVTDDVAPTIVTGPTPNAVWNPTEVSVTGTDEQTRVTGYQWSITGPNSFERVGMSRSETVTLPTLTEDGEYLFTVQAVDFAGNLSVPKTVALDADHSAPTITAERQNIVSTEANPVQTPTTAAGWIALFGVTATDATSGMPTTGNLGISVDASAVGEGAGEFEITFTATDIAGNVSEPLTVTYTVAFVGVPEIMVTSDEERFEMERDGSGWVSLTDAELIALFGVTAAPAHNSAPIVSITVDKSGVNFGQLGSYEVRFQAVDSLGTTTQEVSGTIIVEDTIDPVLVLTHEERTFEQGDTEISPTDAPAWVALFGATATDTGSGINPTGIQVDASAVDYSSAGTYPVIFTVSDVAGNESTETGRYIVNFAGAPTIALGNPGPIEHELGAAPLASSSAEWIALFEVSATAAPGASISSLTADGSDVNWSEEGTYQVTFTATDANGYAATSFGEIVIRDTTAPVVTVATPEISHVMAAPAQPLSGQDWADLFGATATDGNGAGVNESSWNATGSVNWLVPARYEVVLTVSDLAIDPNESDPVSAWITIQAPPTDAVLDARVPQDQEVVVSPLYETVTTGSLEPLTNADVSAPTEGGTVRVQGADLVYKPAAGFYGDESFVVTVTDDLGQTGLVTYNFTIVQKPGLIEGAQLQYTTIVDQQVVIADAASLPELRGNDLRLVSVAAPAGFQGSVAINGSDIVFTTADALWSGTESFSFSVADDLGQSANIPVEIEVVAPALALSVGEGTAGATEVTVSVDHLVPGANYSLELQSSPIHLVDFTATGEGTADITFQVPASATAGAHHVVLFNGSGLERAKAELIVIVEPGDEDTNNGGDTGSGGTQTDTNGGNKDAGDGLSRTGGDALNQVLLIGIPALVILAAVLLFVAARKKKSQN